MALTQEQILQCLRQVKTPRGDQNLVSSNWVKKIAVCDGHVAVSVELPAVSESMKQQIRQQIDQAVHSLSQEVQQVNVTFVERSDQPTQTSPQQAAQAANPLPNIRHVIAVGAGKGGVGKSTIAVNLAVGLARKDLRVGLLDGDIYGPSVPTLLGLENHQQTGTKDRLFPINVAGIKTITIGKLVDPEKPLIWRGPMAHGAFSQLAQQTEWGELDYLIVDLPPGTGDVPLSLAQMLPLSGAVIVCTPQRLAQDDARRAVAMFGQLDVVVLGVVENMSYFIGDDGKEYDLFGRGGAEQMANELVLPLLGTIPINMALRRHSDEGEPLKNFQPGTPLAGELEQLADNLHQIVQQRHQTSADETPTLNIH